VTESRDKLRPEQQGTDMTDRHYTQCFSSPLACTAFLCTIFLVLLFFPVSGYPGQWRVVPARVFLDQVAKSSVIAVVNEGEEKITLQGKAMEWSQDAEGKDQYQETNDLVFFPRILMIDKGEQKIIRTGMKSTATAREKTYRLFIEEIPQPKKSTPDSTQLTVVVRFGVPVFVKPLKEELGAEITSALLTKGHVTTTVRNTGNVHFRITEIAIKGKNGKGEETFATKLDGWYLLTGAARAYSAAIPQDKCVETAQLDIAIATDSKILLKRDLNVEKSQCLP
jgi:fimbrial chaperone protein